MSTRAANLNKIRNGRASLLQSDTYNAMVDAARAEQGRRGMGDPMLPDDPAASNISVLNASGINLPWYGIVLLDGQAPIIDPGASLIEFNQLVGLSVTAPTGAAQNFGVLVKPISPNEIGLATVIGYAQCQILVNSSGDGYATTINGDATKLTSTSTAAGAARIVWKQSGTGVKWAIIALPILTGGGGSLSIDGFDNTGTEQNYTDATELNFDDIPGFYVDESGTTVTASMWAATGSQNGYVNTGAQTFGGSKTFNSGAQAYYSSVISGTFVSLITSNYAGHFDGLYCTANSVIGGGTNANQLGWVCISYNSSGSVFLASFYIDPQNACLVLNGNSGYTGTGGAGDVIVGGIVTVPGSGKTPLEIANGGGTAQTANTSTGTPSTLNGFYRVNYYLFTSAAGSAGTVMLSVGWTDPTSTAQSVSSGSIVLTLLGSYQSGAVFCYCKASTGITISTNVTGLVGATYDYQWTIDKL